MMEMTLQATYQQEKQNIFLGVHFSLLKLYKLSIRVNHVPGNTQCYEVLHPQQVLGHN